jgi:hypothetical protein
MKNDIEDDEDLPIELFDKIVSECTDIICSSNSPHEMFITSSDSSTN